MAGVRFYPTAEILIERPSHLNKYNWKWCVYLPDVQGQPTIYSGSGNDYEDSWDKAVRAKNYLQKHGLNGDKETFI